MENGHKWLVLDNAYERSWKVIELYYSVCTLCTVQSVYKVLLTDCYLVDVWRNA